MAKLPRITISLPDAETNKGIRLASVEEDKTISELFRSAAKQIAAPYVTTPKAKRK